MGHGNVGLPLLRDAEERIVNKVGVRHKSEGKSYDILYSVLNSVFSLKNTPESWMDIYVSLVICSYDWNWLE